MNLDYVGKVLGTARRCLMLPYDVEEAIDRAFDECSIVLSSMIEKNDSNDNTKTQISKLEEFISKRSKTFSDEEKFEICNIIDDLASSYSYKN